jgi:hypothetical protein
LLHNSVLSSVTLSNCTDGVFKIAGIPGHCNGSFPCCSCSCFNFTGKQIYPVDDQSCSL